MTSLFANPWSVSDIRWDVRFIALYLSLQSTRAPGAAHSSAVDARSGAVKPIINETNATFIDYSGKSFTEYLDDTGEIIWMSERDGWNHSVSLRCAQGRGEDIRLRRANGWCAAWTGWTEEKRQILVSCGRDSAGARIRITYISHG